MASSISWRSLNSCCSCSRSVKYNRSALTELFRSSLTWQSSSQLFKQRCDQKSILLQALQACSSCNELEIGKRIHSHASESGEDTGLHIANTLLHMYLQCGSPVLAQNIFDKMADRDLVSWNVLVQGYANQGEGNKALDLFTRMVSEGCQPDSRSFVAAAVACSSLAAREPGKRIDDQLVKLGSLSRGMEIHSQAVSTGFSSNIFVSSALINMYSKCGSLLDARMVFDSMQAHNVVSWTSLILGYVEHHDMQLVLELFDRMQDEGCAPNSRTYMAALMACSGLAEKQNSWCLEKGLWIHQQAEKNGFTSDMFVASSLVGMYARCGSFTDALRVFQSSRKRDVILWNTLILGLVDAGEFESALDFFTRMEATGSCEPDARSYVAALSACSSLAMKEEAHNRERWLEKGMELHAGAKKKEFDSGDVFVACSLVEMYSKCGRLPEARSVFERTHHPDSALWNSLMNGYVYNGQPDEALSLFFRMKLENRQPDVITLVAALTAISSSAAKLGDHLNPELLEKGMEIHHQVSEAGLESDAFIASSLVEMYSKLGRMEEAQRVFDKMKKKKPDIVLWSGLILGYAESGDGERALELLLEMKSRGMEPNPRTYVGALLACGTELETGKKLHGELCRRGFERDEFAGNSVLDFYGRCGSLDEAGLVFDSMVKPGVVAWSSIISAYSRRGESSRVLELFGEMQEEGVRADGVTLKSILATCSHAGLIEAGKKLLGEMLSRFGVEPEIEHFHCVVDMLGRGNMLREAMALVEGMPFRANAVSWKTLLAACRKWRNVEVGRVAFERLVEVDEGHEAGYVLMSNLYASLGMWEEQLRVLELKEKMKLSRG